MACHRELTAYDEACDALKRSLVYAALSQKGLDRLVNERDRRKRTLERCERREGPAREPVAQTNPRED
jgi:hypothetical protein